MATTALGRLTLDLAVRMSEFTDGLDRAARETADATREMGESVTEFKDTLLESLSGSPIGGAIDSLTDKLGSITDAFGSGGLAGAAKVGGIAIAGAFVGATTAIISMAIETSKTDAQLERLAKKVTTNKIVAGVIRFFISLLKTPYCTGIGQVTSSIYQFITVNVMFHKNFVIDKEGKVLEKEKSNEIVCN